MKYLLLDVAGTLLHKPSFFEKFREVMLRFGYDCGIDDLRFRHRVLSEAIHFPDRTSSSFYADFNSKFILSLGIIPTDEMIAEVFSACSYLPWERFEDTDVLSEINCRAGILSNFNSSLREKLDVQFPHRFEHVFVSEEMGIAKPESGFYKKAIESIGLDASEIVYVGDSVRLDVAPALALGMNALLIDRDNYFPLQQHRISSLRQLKAMFA